MKKAAPLAALLLVGGTLAGCLVPAAPYYGSETYAEPRPVYVVPRYEYRSRWNWHRNHGHGGNWHGGNWHGGNWHGNRHHWD